MRVIVIEAVDNGYVLRQRVGDDMSAEVHPDPGGLKSALEATRAYFLAPVDTTSQSPSFGMIPALKVELRALEPKKYRTPVPTACIFPRTQSEVATVKMSRTEIESSVDQYRELDSPFEDIDPNAETRAAGPGSPKVS